MSIIVSGGQGFIGRHLVRALRSSGQVVIVAEKGFLWDRASPCDAVFHLGAITDTSVDWDAALESNFEVSRFVLDWCEDRGVPLIYASSASVYGNSPTCREWIDDAPRNAYAWSKRLFDLIARERLARKRQTIAGLRFFNVYGDGEESKGAMASPVHRFAQQIRKTGKCDVFQTEGREAKRDFVHVSDVVKVMIWAWEKKVSGVYNVGSGVASGFLDVARLVVKALGHGKIEMRPFPSKINLNAYQWHTCADLTALRLAGYDAEFIMLDAGVDVTMMPRVFL